MRCPPHSWRFTHMEWVSVANPPVLRRVKAECHSCAMQVADLRLNPGDRIVDQGGNDITSQISTRVMMVLNSERTSVLDRPGGSSDDVCTNMGGRLRCAFEEWSETGRYYCRWCGEAARPENSEPVQWVRQAQANAGQYAIRPGPPWVPSDGHRRRTSASEHAAGHAVDLNA